MAMKLHSFCVLKIPTLSVGFLQVKISSNIIWVLSNRRLLDFFWVLFIISVTSINQNKFIKSLTVLIHCTLQISMTHILVGHHTCYSCSSSFQGKGIIEVKLAYVTQSTMPSDNLSVMDSWKRHIHTNAHTKMCQHILWVLLDRNREWQW